MNDRIEDAKITGITPPVLTFKRNVRARAAVLAAADDTFRVLHHDAPVATLDEHNRGDDGDRHGQQEQDPDRTDIPARHLIQDAQDGVRQHDDNAGEDDQ